MRLLLILSGAALMAVSGCSGPAADQNEHAAAADAPGTDPHLRCAAMISAADRVMIARTVPTDPDLQRDSLVAAMTHLNAYSIPKRMAEKDAFAAVDAERARILSSLTPAQIVAEAKACLATVPGR